MADDKNTIGPDGKDIYMKGIQDAKGRFTTLAKILEDQNKSMMKEQEKSTSSIKSVREAIKEGNEKVKTSSDAQKDVIERMGELQLLGFSQSEAKSLAQTGAAIKQLEQDRQQIAEILEKNSLDVDNDKQIQALDAQINALKGVEVMEEVAEELSGFQKRFKFFSEEKFDELRKDVQEGGRLTTRGIAKGFQEDLRGDFDKLLSFFGPAVSLLQQIPLLGTLLNVVKALGTKLFTEMFLARKSDDKNTKKVVQSNKETTDVLHADLDAQLKEARRERRDAMKRRLTGSKDGSGDTLFEGDTQEGDTNLGGGMIGLGYTLKQIANPESAAGITAFGTGLASLAALPVIAGAAKLAAAILLIGGSTALVLAGFIAATAAGFLAMEKAGTAKTFKDLSDPAIDYMKIAGGLAAIGGGSILSGLGGLVQTITTLGGTFTPFTDLGEDLGGFARGAKPFSELDTQKVAKNFMILKSDIMDNTQGFWANVGDWMTGGSKEFSIIGKDLGTFAKNVKPFVDLQMTQFLKNMILFQSAIDHMNYPRINSTNARNWLFHLKQLGNIELADSIGLHMQDMGKGITMIADGLENMSTLQIEKLQDLGDSLQNNFDDVFMNFGPVVQVAGGGMNLRNPETEYNRFNQPIVVNQVDGSTVNQHNTSRYFSTEGGITHAGADVITANTLVASGILT